ncbi:MAG: hypothetical protein ACK5L5_08175 [Bacteroidales bacterium]
MEKVLDENRPPVIYKYIGRGVETNSRGAVRYSVRLNYKGIEYKTLVSRKEYWDIEQSIMPKVYFSEKYDLAFANYEYQYRKFYAKFTQWLAILLTTGLLVVVIRKINKITTHNKNAEKILSIMKEAGEPIHIRDLTKALRLENREVGKIISSMRYVDAVSALKGGFWKLNNTDNKDSY